MAYHHGDLRRALITASSELLDEGGSHALSLRAAARKAGVSAAAPYRHFEDKNALLAAVAVGAFGALATSMRDAFESGSGDEDLLRRVGLAYVRFAVENVGCFRLMFGPELSDRPRFPEVTAAAHGSFAVLLEAIEWSMERGRIASGDPMPLATACWATLHGVSHLVVAGQLGPLDADGAEVVANMVAETLLHGLAPR
jgi:AcrR family transcriptional regulator